MKESHAIALVAIMAASLVVALILRASATERWEYQVDKFNASKGGDVAWGTHPNELGDDSR